MANSKAYDKKQVETDATNTRRRIVRKRRDAYQLERERSINHPVLFTCKLQPPVRERVDSPFAAIPPPSISNLYIIHGNQPVERTKLPKLWNIFRRANPRKSVPRNRGPSKSGIVRLADRYLSTERTRRAAEWLKETPRFVLGFQWRVSARDRQTIRERLLSVLPVLYRSGISSCRCWSANKTLACAASTRTNKRRFTGWAWGGDAFCFVKREIGDDNDRFIGPRGS